MADDAKCIRCRDADPVDQHGYCGHCHWAIRSEIDQGLAQLHVYLGRHAGFRAWLADHGREPE